MVQERIPETDEGIQDIFTVDMFNRMQRHMRDRGWIETTALIQCGITTGQALEIGPGPGYLGLEWLKSTTNSSLAGLDISPEMLKTAKKNAREYGLCKRVDYVEGNCMELPFTDRSFDAVFSSGSLHEWEDPVRVFNEIHRVLKDGGRLFISDLRRDMNSLLFRFMKLFTRPKEMKPGLVTSVRAAYTKNELEGLLSTSLLSEATVSQSPAGLSVSGKKACELDK